MGPGAWPCPAVAGKDAPPWFSAEIAPFRSPTRQVIWEREHVGRRQAVSRVHEAEEVDVAGYRAGKRAPFSVPRGDDFLEIPSAFP